ncbi:MAG: hypothetical protein WBA44_12970 [Mesorhizobium sp.]
MGALALADFLVDFDPRPRTAAAPPPALLAVVPDHASPPPDPGPAPPDVDSIVAEAVAAAEAAVAARFQEEMDARLAEQEERHRSELDRARADAGVELGGRLMEQLATFEAAAIDAATSVAARILGQVVTQTIATRSVTALAACIRDAMADADTVKVRVRGPQALFMPLAAAMGDKAHHLEFSEDQSTDLTVTVDETMFTTRMAEWSAALSDVIR